MTETQIRLYVIARMVVPADTRIRTIAERTSTGNLLYTLELTKGDEHRWFAASHRELRLIPERMVVEAIRRAIERPAASPGPRE